MPEFNSYWYKTDNVAKVFLATRNRRDTRSLRISCTLNTPVDAALLQQAVNEAVSFRPQFQVRIRRGFFWHYLEGTDALPEVKEEAGRPCPILYGSEYSGVLHFNVSYFGNRINLDMFHALSDGTGAMEFMNVLVVQYLKLLYPGELENITLGNGASAGEHSQDSFEQFYDKETKTPLLPQAAKGIKKSYHIHSLRLPYDQLQFLEIKMDSSALRAKSKEIGAGLTAYLAAKMMIAIHQDAPMLKRRMPITVSIPVNLRNYFPSETSRNFFNSVKISHVFDGSETLESLCKEFDEKLKDDLRPEKIRQQMDGFQRLERLIFVRMVPLFIKQPVVKHSSKKENKRISFVLSNLGQIKPEEAVKPYIKGYTAFCSHDEMFMTAYSYDDTLTLGVTYGFVDTGVLRNFVRAFTEDGISVTVNSTEVIR